MRSATNYSFLTPLLAAGLALILTGCLPQSTRLRQDQILDLTWKALEPYTSSQNRGNWEVAEVNRVLGREVVDEFPGLQISNCPGPNPPENAGIRSSSEYWFVRVVPRRLPTPTPKKGGSTATPYAISPEPLFNEARFLVDPFSGEIVARNFDCQRNLP